MDINKLIKPEHPENITPGIYILILNEKVDETYQDSYSGIEEMMGMRKKKLSNALPVTGVPLEVLAIRLPFICVHNGNESFAVDLRENDVVICPKKYAVEFRTNRRVSRSSSSFFDSMYNNTTPLPEISVRKRKKKEKPDPKNCPQCECPGVLIRREGSIKWYLYCPDCDEDWDIEDPIKLK